MGAAGVGHTGQLLANIFTPGPLAQSVAVPVTQVENFRPELSPKTPWSSPPGLARRLSHSRHLINICEETNEILFCLFGNADM